MKSVLKIFFLILLPIAGSAQGEIMYRDSLLIALSSAVNDSSRLDINRKLGFYHQDGDAGSALIYHQTQLALAQKLNLKLWEADAYQQIAYCYSNTFHLSEAYENYMLGLKIAEDSSSAANGWGFYNFSNSKSPEDARRSIVGMIHFELSGLYERTRYKREVLTELLKAAAIGESLKNQKILSLSFRDIGKYYLNSNNPDSALIYFKKAMIIYQNSPYQKNLGELYRLMGQYYIQKEQYDSAKISFRKGRDASRDPAELVVHGNIMQAMGLVYIKTGQLDSALIYTLQGEKIADSSSDVPGKAVILSQLGTIYKLKNEYSIAYDYLEKGKNLSDKLNDGYINRLMKFQNLDFEQKFRLQELEKESQQVKSRNRMIAVLTGLGIFILVAILLYRNNRQKQKANKVLEATLANLRSTQSQLIQSEKMASLGELTAGIAHEIQNPLNFVNNFSEVNSELIEELKVKNEKLKIEDEEVKDLINDIEQNLEKINHHGKRADAIVKSMLQHSRSSNGMKELTDINALCDEYLRLSYHGLRAKDKSFNAITKTDFDENIGKINIIPQDIGRVVLNLINNAFYAVHEKQKLLANGYQPLVEVKTRNINNKVEISVKDTGNGIPESIKEKIFQPFFTTKPTGSGTGLGLSLSYDIVKSHGGELKVAKTGESGTEFILVLPG